MNILFISRWFPFPPDNGSKIRIFNLVKQLSINHDITLLSFTHGLVSKERLTEMIRYCSSIRTSLYKNFRPGRPKALGGLFSNRPRFLVDTYSQDMQKIVKQESTKNKFDVVIASEVDTVSYAILVDKIPRVIEDIELLSIYEQFINQHSVLPKIRYGLTWWKTSRFIAQVLSKFDGFTVVSEQERDLIRKMKPECNMFAIVPNGIDLEANTGKFNAPEPGTLIYSGALTYSANFDAMEFFLNDIFPLITAEEQNVILRITGDYKDVPINSLPLSNGVELTGYLDDIRPAVAQSWVCVVPLRKGGGTRLKILEAMALGTPVISTSKGAEGLEVIHEQNILIADNPDDFARAVLRLLRDKHLRANLSANGRQLVEKQYSWNICAGHLEQLLYKVVDLG